MPRRRSNVLTACRTRNTTITPLAEKGLISAKPAAKQKALEAILLYVEMDTAPPVVDELLPLLSHKLPKIVAAVLSSFTAMIHAFGVKTVNPKPIVQSLPNAFGHADKNVRAEAQNLSVELYRWLRESVKPLFWNDLKPVQQQDLEKLFEKVKGEPTPKPERLLKSQQAAAEAAAAAPEQAADDGEEEGPADADEEPEMMTVDVFPQIPKDLHDRLGSSKWKDRKEALDDLHTAVNVPAMQEGPFDEIVRALAKCMKDANIAVVTIAANCTELIAKGLRKSFAKYRSIIFNPIVERLKERKPSVTEALAGALDAICASSSLNDCLDDVLAALSHKNPLIKLESTKFIARALKATREAPGIPETKAISEACLKLLTDSQDHQRNAGAEVLGVLWKIMGDRVMNPQFEGLDDIRKSKIKEYMDAAEVKSKYKPKAAAPPAPKATPAVGQKKPVGKRPAAAAPAATKKPPPPPLDDSPAAPLQPRPTAHPGGVPRPASIAAPRGLKPPSAGTAGRKLPTPSSGSGIASPRRPPPLSLPSVEDDQPSVPAPKISRGLTGRQLSKPSAEQHPAPQPVPASGSNSIGGTQPLLSIERMELDELRAETERLKNANETLRGDHLKLSSQVHELQNQNAQLIEDHTRDVLSVKAKETQLVRARSDAETAEQSVSSLQREVERLKRELGRMGRAGSPRTTGDFSAADIFPTSDSAAERVGGASGGPRSRATVMSPTLREGKENFPSSTSKTPSSQHPVAPAGAMAHRTDSMRSAGSGTSPRRPLSSSSRTPAQTLNANGYGNGVEAAGAHGSSHGSSAGGPPNMLSDGSDAKSSQTSRSSQDGANANGRRLLSGGPGSSSGDGQGEESWKRAAEVTQNLKARIELMKARQQAGAGGR